MRFAGKRATGGYLLRRKSRRPPLIIYACFRPCLRDADLVFHVLLQHIETHAKSAI